MVTRKNIINYERVQGQEFVDVIRAQKPIAVHAYRVSSEHDEVYSFSFLGRNKRVHCYWHEIDDYTNPIIGEEQMKKFAELYGVPMVGGRVEYYYPEKERYLFFDTLRVEEHKGFSSMISYKAWQKTVESLLDVKKKNVLVRAVSPKKLRNICDKTIEENWVIIDVTTGKDHVVLDFKPTRELTLNDVIRENLRGYKVIDVTPYACWLETVERENS